MTVARAALPLLTAALVAVTPLAAAIPPPGPDDRNNWPGAPGWYSPVGVLLGGSTPLGHDRDGGFLVGVEASLVYLFDTTWAGAFVDARWLPRPELTRLALGVEAGWAFFGAELAATAELREDTAVAGVRVGVVVSFAFVAFVARWQHLVDAPAPDALELGVLLKWPIAW